MKTLVAFITSVCLMGLLSIKTLAQSIEFTSIPSAGTSGNLRGFITGVENPEDYKLALVIDVFGSLWSKPTFATPHLWIKSNGTFDGRFITGGQDICASRIHAFLVPIDYTIPLTSGGSQIPKGLIDTALAYAVAERSATKTVEWSGYIWGYKDTGDCIWGPGPNYFSKYCVVIDAQGRLHLTIRYIDGEWRCPEIIMIESLGYGAYDFYLDSSQEGLPNPIVLGKFTYDDDPSFTHREVDLEYSNGIVVGRPNPRQVAIQPYTAPNQRLRYSDPEGMVQSMHSFIWLPGQVLFSSYDGHPVWDGTFNTEYEIVWNMHPSAPWMRVTEIGTIELAPPSNQFVYEGTLNAWAISQYFMAQMRSFARGSDMTPYLSWSTTAGVPPIGNEKVHINLWLFEGKSPGPVNEKYTVIVNRFEFIPMEELLPPLRPSLKISDVISSRENSSTKLKLELTVPAK